MFKLTAKIATIPDWQGRRAGDAYPPNIGNGVFAKLFAENLLMFL